MVMFAPRHHKVVVHNLEAEKKSLALAIELSALALVSVELVHSLSPEFSIYTVATEISDETLER